MQIFFICYEVEIEVYISHPEPEQHVCERLQIRESFLSNTGVAFVCVQHLLPNNNLHREYGNPLLILLLDTWVALDYNEYRANQSHIRVFLEVVQLV
jgi:hypothetical protein